MIIDAQKNDEKLHKKVQLVIDSDKTHFSVKEDEVCISIIDYVCQLIMS